MWVVTGLIGQLLGRSVICLVRCLTGQLFSEPDVCWSVFVLVFSCFGHLSRFFVATKFCLSVVSWSVVCLSVFLLVTCLDGQSYGWSVVWSWSHAWLVRCLVC